MKLHEWEKYRRKNPAAALQPRALSTDEFSAAVVIPVCDELEFLPETLRSLTAAREHCARRVAVILVVNHPPEAPERVREASFELLRRLRREPYPDGFWVDAATHPEPGGVGRARKLGMDAFVHSLSPERLETAWMASLDADSPVAPGYLDALDRFFAERRDCSAVTVGFRHRTGDTPELECAIRRYEAYLKNYVEKLRTAGSPYAFYSVGSAFAVRAESYLRCGGMRVRTGGEDFYFLQAAAKTGKIGEIVESLVFPSPRPSERVPFGTGPAVRKLLAGGELEEIDEAAFAVLKQLLERDPATFPDGLPEAVRPFFELENFAGAWASIRKNTPPEKWRGAFHCYFDGLKTLRLLHFLRDREKHSEKS